MLSERGHRHAAGAGEGAEHNQRRSHDALYPPVHIGEFIAMYKPIGRHSDANETMRDTCWNVQGR